MAKAEEETETTTTTTETEKQLAWGTWEELLLACAVNRHGTKNWDSVAMEIQKRSSSPHFLWTPLNCKEKYHDLNRRFTEKTDDFKDGLEVNDRKVNEEKMPWLEELRKLRVVELRREVQRSDVSIVSLQLKVKRLKEEREQSLREEEESEPVKSDPEVRNTTEEKKESGGGGDEVEEEEDRSVPLAVETGNPVSGEEIQSRNESNSPDPKGENRGTGAEGEPEKTLVPVEKSVPVTTESPGDKPVGEGSCNGSSETIAKETVVQVVEKVPEEVPGDSPDLWESVAESSKQVGEGTKESSDVQSSTSLSRKNHRQKVVVSGCSSGEEPETDVVSPRKQLDKSQPLERFLQMIRWHKYGSIFERRLHSQETTKYESLIRQHLDLEIIHKRLKEGHYSGYSKFYRDLLLLFNNALVFFPKNSHEVVAAQELRQLVSKEMSVRFPKSTQPSIEEVTPTLQPSSIPKPDPAPTDSLLLKTNSSGPIVTCKKRSSITARASTSTGEKKPELKPALIEKKTIQKQQDNPTPIVVEEQGVIKKRKRDKSRSSRAKVSKSVNNTDDKNPNLNSDQDRVLSSNPNSKSKAATSTSAAVGDDSEQKSEKEKKNSTTVAKKRSVANFLNRMKRNSSSNGTLLESLKNSAENSNSGKGGATEQKKTGGRNDSKKEQVTRNSSSAKQTRDQSSGKQTRDHSSLKQTLDQSNGKQVQDQSNSPGKRGVGRPSKRKNASPVPPPSSSKRTREKVEPEMVAASRQPRKRARR